MDFDDYQALTKKTAVYPSDKALEYLALGLAGEAGEVANKVKKILRGDQELTQDVKNMISDELGDCLWYISELSTKLETRLMMIAGRNIDKLLKRKVEGKIRGSGDDR